MFLKAEKRAERDENFHICSYMVLRMAAECLDWVILPGYLYSTQFEIMLRNSHKKYGSVESPSREIAKPNSDDVRSANYKLSWGW